VQQIVQNLALFLHPKFVSKITSENLPFWEIKRGKLTIAKPYAYFRVFRAPEIIGY
jgi:hypothetical protein